MRRWVAVVPVKPLASAKTRLALAARADLALAFAADTVAAALACDDVAAVVVVTDDARAAAQLRALGAHVVADEPDSGLNAALVHGAREAVALVPGAGVVALAADLPALTSEALSAVLAEASRVPAAYVADHTGAGTTLLVATDLASFTPRFGPASAAAHERLGAVRLGPPAAERVSRDVDTVEDLLAAAALGVGPRTAAVLTSLALV